MWQRGRPAQGQGQYSLDTPLAPFPSLNVGGTLDITWTRLLIRRLLKLGGTLGAAMAVFTSNPITVTLQAQQPPAEPISRCTVVPFKS